MLLAHNGGGGRNTSNLSGEISVSDTKVVRFTKGNLYWDDEFKMEKNQYDFRTWRVADSNDTSGETFLKNAVINGIYCETPANESNESTTGLFYWSKDIEKTYLKLYDASDAVEGDTFAIAKTEGHDAAIAGDDNYYYDLLTESEWEYILNRKDSDNKLKYGLATIKLSNTENDSVRGVVILPDTFNKPFTPAQDEGTGILSSFDKNVYSKAEWEKMDKAGAVFLPVTGRRNYGAWEGATYNVDDITKPNTHGHYFTTSLEPGQPKEAIHIWINGSTVQSSSSMRYYAGSVRLVAIKKSV